MLIVFRRAPGAGLISPEPTGTVAPRLRSPAGRGAGDGWEGGGGLVKAQTARNRESWGKWGYMITSTSLSSYNHQKPSVSF